MHGYRAQKIDFFMANCFGVNEQTPNSGNRSLALSFYSAVNLLTNPPATILRHPEF